MSVEEKVRITADDSGLKQVQKTAESAFSPKIIEAYHKAAKGLKDELTKVVSEQASLTKSLREVERGSEAYEKLRRRLSMVRDESRVLRESLDGLKQVHGDLDRREDRREQSLARRRSFFGGLMQGAGVAQYFPAESGMGARVAGNVVGGIGRRVAGGLAAPFMQPGVGGMAGMLGAIPGVGGALSGALQQGAGFFGEATAFDVARLQNLPYAYLGTAEGRARSAAAQKKVRFGGEYLGAELGTEWAGSVITSRPEITDIKPKPGWVQGVRGPGGGIMMQAPAGAVLERAGEKFVTPESLIAASKEKRERQAMIAAGGTETGIPGAGFGIGLGMTSTEVQQSYGAYMGAKGGAPKTEREAIENLGKFRETLAIQRRYGIGAQLAGQYERQFMPGAGGIAGEGTGLGRTIGTALVQGLQGSQIREYLERIAQATTAMEQEGVRFDVRNLTGTSMMLQAGGIQGLQASRISMGLAQSARQTSAGGVQSPVQMLMARAAGWTPEGGAESYAGAMEELEGGMSPKVMARFIGMVTSGARAGGFGPKMQALMVRRAMREVGVPIGTEQAGSLIETFGAGGPTQATEERLQKMLGGAKGIERKGFFGAAQIATGRVGGLAQFGAKMEAERIEKGYDLAPLMKKMQESSMRMVDAVARASPALEVLADKVLWAADKIAKGGSIIGEWVKNITQTE